MGHDLKKRIYKIFDPAEPVPADEPDLYVELDEVRGREIVVQRLKENIDLSTSFTCQALTGHKGSGKSTELLRLKSQLEKEGYFVVYCETRHDIDDNDVDFLEVLISIIRQLAVQVKDGAKISLKSGYFKDRWERLKKLALTEIDFSSLDLAAGLAKIRTVLKSSPDVRKEIRKALEPDSGNWISAANDVIGEAILELKKKGKKGLVIIADDLDKMITRPFGETGRTTSEYLFINRHQQLAGFKCHMVYTMPLALVYSYCGPTITKLYGGHVPVVPMTRIRNRPGKAEGIFERGYSKMRDMIDRRLTKANARFDDVFQDTNVRDELIRISGGQPSDLMIYIRGAMIRGGLPIEREAVDLTAQEAARTYVRQHRLEYEPILKDVHEKGVFQRTDDSERFIRELLDSRAILQYLNGGEWYALNPVIPLDIVTGQT